MKFKFYENESKIYDFLQFPKCIHYKEYIRYISGEERVYKEVVSDSYKDLMMTITEKLKPYIKEIKTFYSGWIYEFEFIELIMDMHSILNYQSAIDYLDYLLTLDEYEIKKSMIYSLIASTKENEESHNEETSDLIISKDKILNFINNLALESDLKWNLFLIIQNPKKHMKNYVCLMKKLYPLFNEFYQVYHLDIKEYGNYIVEFLNDKGSEGLKELSFSILNDKIFEEDINKVFVSSLFPYSITINKFEDDQWLVWGRNVEDILKKLKEKNENKTNERVRIFKNLGDRTRYDVLKLISQGITSTKKIANNLGVSSATISYHINTFLTSKVIKLASHNRKLGYIVDYKILEDTFNDFKDDMNFPKK